MLQTLLYDCGKKIQKIALVYLVLGLIGTLVLAIVFGSDRHGEIIFWPFIGILVGGGFLTYVNMLLLNGFGCIVKNSEEQLYELKQEKLKASTK